MSRPRIRALKPASVKLNNALAEADKRSVIVRTGKKFWINLKDHRIPKKWKVVWMSGISAFWAAWFVCPFDGDFLAPFLGPLFFLILLDDIFLAPVLGVSLFNKWADWYRKKYPRA